MKTKQNKIILFLFISTMITGFSFAEGTTFASLSKNLTIGILAGITKLGIALAVLFFFYGIFIFVFKEAGDSGTRKDGLNKILYGIVSIFVLSGVWAILYFFSNSIGLDNSKGLNISLDGRTTYSSREDPFSNSGSINNSDTSVLNNERWGHYNGGSVNGRIGEGTNNN